MDELLGVDPVGALPIRPLEGLDLEAHLLAQAAADEAAHAVGLPAGSLLGVDEQMHLGRRVSRYISA